MSHYDSIDNHYHSQEVEDITPRAVSTTQFNFGCYLVIFFCPSTGYRYFKHGVQFKFEIGDAIPLPFYSLSSLFK
tara:strand:+ start:17041 stop:17265 length:225 start_codon:yes stop_codon:yes gene_type:complete